MSILTKCIFSHLATLIIAIKIILDFRFKMNYDYLTEMISTLLISYTVPVCLNTFILSALNFANRNK